MDYSDVDDPRDELARQVGRVAMAHATLDEWCSQLAARLLRVDDVELLKVFFGRDSTRNKIGRIKGLAEALGATGLTAGDPSLTIIQILKKADALNDRRDVTLHAHYLDTSSEDDPLFRYRTRFGQTEPVDLDEIRGVEEELVQASLLIEQLVRAVELEQVGNQRIADLVQDALDVVTALRFIRDERIEPLIAATDGGTTEVEVLLGGYGRWAVGGHDAIAPPWEVIARCTIDPVVGRADLALESGEQVQAGDTGWRKVTEDVQRELPDIKHAALRRVGGLVRYTDDRLEGLPTPTLDQRIVSGHPDLVAMLPDFLQSLEGFRPSDEVKDR
jgi:hypothetical protein